MKGQILPLAHATNVNAVRPATFDPNVDPIARMEAARLRDRRREYYETDGKDDPVHIDLLKGTYTPQIEFRTEATSRTDRPMEPAELPGALAS